MNIKGLSISVTSVVIKQTCAISDPSETGVMVQMNAVVLGKIDCFKTSRFVANKNL